MRKYIALVLALVCVLGLVGCDTKSMDYIIENKDSYTDLSVGDEIVVYHDGNVMETDPESSEEAVVGSDLIPMAMVNGELYMDTGHESTVEARCGVMDGEITSTVESWEKPTEDNQSNFGVGFGYQIGVEEGTIEIYVNGKWWVFEAERTN